MRRILLLLEDYNEQIFLETLLKKIGFDILSVRNELSLQDQIMIFKPDVIIATGDGAKIKGPNVNKKIVKNKTPVKLILLFPINKLQDQKLMSMFSADVAAETPVNPRVLIQTICTVTQLDVDAVMRKFEKLPIAKNDSNVKTDGIRIVSGKFDDKRVYANEPPAPQPSPSIDRKKKYAEILKNSDQYEDLGFAKKKVTAELDKIRKFEKDSPELKKLDEERKNFVLALYKK